MPKNVSLDGRLDLAKNRNGFTSSVQELTHYEDAPIHENTIPGKTGIRGFWILRKFLENQHLYQATGNIRSKENQTLFPCTAALNFKVNVINKYKV